MLTSYEEAQAWFDQIEMLFAVKGLSEALRGPILPDRARLARLALSINLQYADFKHLFAGDAPVHTIWAALKDLFRGSDVDHNLRIHKQLMELQKDSDELLDTYLVRASGLYAEVVAHRTCSDDFFKIQFLTGLQADAKYEAYVLALRANSQQLAASSVRDI